MILREEMIDFLSGKKIAKVPFWPMGFFNEETARRLMPGELFNYDSYIYPPTGHYDFLPHSEEELKRTMKFNEYIGKCGVGVGRGANFAFGHDGPGEFNYTLIAKNEEFAIYECETGVKVKLNFSPHNYYIFDHPVKTYSDIGNLKLPDPSDNSRFIGFQKDVEWFKRHNVFTYGNLNGFFSGVHYFFRDFQNTLMDLLTDKKMINAILSRLGEWNLTAAEQMLKAGVDCICFCEDLGTETSLLMNPAIYKELFFPWHKKLAELVHQYGKFLHMHSHGNLTELIDTLVETGIDILNPLDPAEGNDIIGWKKKYGEKIRFAGGLSKNFWKMSLNEMKKSITEILSGTNREVMLMSASGVPEDLEKDKFQNAISLFKEASQ
jgi:hypothetical protein